jgi:tRNA (guanine37-N1)-methyltransferase
MRIDIITLFPEMFAPLEHSIIRRAREAGHLEIALHQLRDYATDKHRMVDDIPYGGGPGMVMKPEPTFAAVRAVQQMASPRGRVVLTTPQGRRLDQREVERLAGYPRLIVLCGHYEGFDQRVSDALVDDEISLGDFVLTGGEIPAMALVDAVARLQPEVLDEASLDHESFNDGLLEAPHYTRPRVWENLEVPEVLLSGHHAEIEKWRRREAIRRTAERRPDLLAEAVLSAAERRWAEQVMGNDADNLTSDNHDEVEEEVDA